MLEPPIGARQARKGVELLLSLGLLEQTRTGFHPTHKLITSGADVQALALRDFHIQNLELALRSIDAVPRADRDLSCVVMALSKEAFARAGAEVAAFRKRLLELSAQDGRPTRVYHFGFLAYPTTGEAGQVREGLP